VGPPNEARLLSIAAPDQEIEELGNSFQIAEGPRCGQRAESANPVAFSPFNPAGAKATVTEVDIK
jgi:hypothetical protein